MELSVTDIQDYSTHCTRSAVSSKVKSMGGATWKRYKMCTMEVWKNIRSALRGVNWGRIRYSCSTGHAYMYCNENTLLKKYC